MQLTVAVDVCTLHGLGLGCAGSAADRRADARTDAGVNEGGRA